VRQIGIATTVAVTHGSTLNETGRQALELAAQVNDIDAIYSSDTERAHETAVIVANQHGLHVEIDRRLREVNFGFWEGLTRAEINERFSGGFTHWLSGESTTPDGGEADELMAERVLAALHEIATRHHDGS
jgi:broad specificity phosphatase PhoE